MTRSLKLLYIFLCSMSEKSSLLLRYSTPSFVYVFIFCLLLIMFAFVFKLWIEIFRWSRINRALNYSSRISRFDDLLLIFLFSGYNPDHVLDLNSSEIEIVASCNKILFIQLINSNLMRLCNKIQDLIFHRSFDSLQLAAAFIFAETLPRF